MPVTEPSNAADVRKVVEERLAALGTGLQETETVEWRDQQLSLPVISMPVELLSYNPGTHRIRAQRSLDSARDQELHTDPFGVAGQAYLHVLLMGSPTDPSRIDPSFEALAEDLKINGQSEPGIITRAGVLINGNTRRAALKTLGRENIRVAVLPPDAGHDDQRSIELSLQLRKEFKRDYSFMNMLLAIDERVQAGRPAAEIQSDFRIQAKTYDKYRWILSFVLQAIERSRVVGTDGASTAMRLVDFESDQGKLEELHRAYASLKAKSPEDAELLYEQRLLAVALSKSKTDLRHIEPDFSEKYMQKAIPTPAAASAAVMIPGTSISAAAPSPRLAAIREYTTKVLQARAIERDPTTAPPDVLAKATKILEDADTAVDAALDKAGKNSRVTKKRYAASERVSDATEDLDLAVQAVADARSTGNFDLTDLDDAISALRASIKMLAQTATRGADPATLPRGAAWLRDAATLADRS